MEVGRAHDCREAGGGPRGSLHCIVHEPAAATRMQPTCQLPSRAVMWQAMRTEFWHTQPAYGGDRVIWDALKAVGTWDARGACNEPSTYPWGHWHCLVLNVRLILLLAAGLRGRYADCTPHHRIRWHYHRGPRHERGIRRARWGNGAVRVWSWDRARVGSRKPGDVGALAEVRQEEEGGRGIIGHTLQGPPFAPNTAVLPVATTGAKYDLPKYVLADPVNLSG